jgi:hypothetical protein
MFGLEEEDLLDGEEGEEIDESDDSVTEGREDDQQRRPVSSASVRGKFDIPSWSWVPDFAADGERRTDAEGADDSMEANR